MQKKWSHTETYFESNKSPQSIMNYSEMAISKKPNRNILDHGGKYSGVIDYRIRYILTEKMVKIVTRSEMSLTQEQLCVFNNYAETSIHPAKIS